MILIIDDDIAVRTSIGLLLKQHALESLSADSPSTGLAAFRENNVSLVIMDMNFSRETSGEEGLALLRKIKTIAPRIPIILITAWGSIALAVEGMKAGATDFINKPWNNDHLLQAVHTALKLSSLNTSKKKTSRASLNNQYDFNAIVGEDPQFLSVLDAVGRVSNTDAAILILGESGTGKELIAEAIHKNSNRSKKPFVKVNLGGISLSLFESEMFGHKKGAFTDAKSDRTGRFEMANGGTIFLDEIGDLDLSSQVKLLRVLQDRTYEVLGDSRTRTLDIRVICATNRNLVNMVENNRFREDLFYRINLITVKLPALRERRNDIPLLVNFFIDNLSRAYHMPGLTVSRDALFWLKDLTLPGNIRELKNLVERTVLVSQKKVLEVEDFSAQLAPVPKEAAQKGLPAIGTMTLDEMEAQMINKALELYEHNISKVAKSLGLSRGALYRRMEKYGISYEA